MEPLCLVECCPTFLYQQIPSSLILPPKSIVLPKLMLPFKVKRNYSPSPVLPFSNFFATSWTCYFLLLFSSHSVWLYYFRKIRTFYGNYSWNQQHPRLRWIFQRWKHYRRTLGLFWREPDLGPNKNGHFSACTYVAYRCHGRQRYTRYLWRSKLE